MLRNESEAVTEANGSVPQQEEFRSGQPKLADVYGRSNETKKTFDELKVMMRLLEQHLASQEQDARQPRLADGLLNTKTRKRTEGAATAVQVINGDSCTTQNVQDGQKISTSFGGKAEPPNLPCREDIVLVEDGAAVPKSCLPFLEMPSPTAVGGLVPTGETSTATKTTYNATPPRLYATEETNPKEANLRTSI